MLAPLMEGPDLESGDGEGGGGGRGGARERKEGWGHWVRGQLARAPSAAAGAGVARSDLRMLLASWARRSRRFTSAPPSRSRTLASRTPPS